MDTTIGLQLRNDFITPVALYSTDETTYKETAVEDDVTQINVAPVCPESHRSGRTSSARSPVCAGTPSTGSSTRTCPRTRPTLGAGMLSPKLSMIIGPWAKTELFVNAGLGFHSNDVRAATERIDPQYSLPQTPVDALERAIGAEVGTRTAIVPHLQSELTLWYMHLASEQIFDGDHGVTTPSFPSDRYGIESANYYTPYKWLTIDADLAYSVPLFGRSGRHHIPGSPTWVVAAGAAVDDVDGFFASLRMHYFGARP